MIVWGGNDGASNLLSTGGLYDPTGDSWSATTKAGAPTGREPHTAVWTGSKMIIWGGYDQVIVFNTGGQHSILSLYVKN